MNYIKNKFDLLYTINNTGCWIWSHQLDSKNQYGIFKIAGTMIGAHRISFEIYKGKIPPNMLVCHSCDVMQCVNPDHLWIGTKKDNAMDASFKGLLTNSQDKRSKLTEHDAITILSLRHKFSQNELAKKYSVSAGCIQSIMDRKNWKYIDTTNVFIPPQNNFERTTLFDRFLASFEKGSDCWNWIGELDNYGYSTVRIGKTHIKGYRLSFELFNSITLPPKLCVCHSCDNRKCVNPDHLWLGSQKDNIRDAISKGRMTKYHKYNTQDILNIISLYYKDGYSTSELSDIYKIDQSYLGNIISGRNWKHLHTEISRSPIRTTKVCNVLTTTEINNIIELRDTMTITQLAEKFNTSRTTIQRVSSEQWSGRKK
jgi:predicted DNA-binding protein YlxM (UPF0122 family)